MTDIYYKWPNACNCGCHGQDPWHRSKYRRIVKKTNEREGFVTLPFSTRPVKVVLNEFNMWIVDKSSITFDK